MSTAKFRRCHDVTKKWEGGWSDHPADPGGKTMYGVTQAVYHAWLRKHGKPVCPVRRITMAEAEQIYFTEYWVPCGGPTLAVGVDLATYDASVNSGVARGRQWLLASIGGPDHETVKRICAKRLGFMRSLNIWNTFGRGWARRVADIEAKGVAWALAATSSSEVAAKHLAKEAETAASTSNKQTAGAGTAGAATTIGGGDVVLNPHHADQIAGWLLSGLLAAGILVVAILIIRATLNKERAAAYRTELRAVDDIAKTERVAA